MIELLWPTPVGVFEVGDEALNREVDAALRAVPTTSRRSNLWDNPAPAIAELSRRMLARAEEVIAHRPVPATIRHGRGWANATRPGEGMTPHAHPRSLLVGVYYLSAPPGSGDLVLMEPASAAMWSDGIDGPLSCRPYRRIAPRPGLAVFFPGHVTHYVEPNRSGSVRVSIAANFQMSY